MRMQPLYPTLPNLLMLQQAMSNWAVIGDSAQLGHLERWHGDVFTQADHDQWMFSSETWSPQLSPKKARTA